MSFDPAWNVPLLYYSTCVCMCEAKVQTQTEKLKPQANRIKNYAKQCWSLEVEFLCVQKYILGGIPPEKDCRNQPNNCLATNMLLKVDENLCEQKC